MFCKMAGVVLYEETGDLLEYRHLVKHPNNKKVWGGAFDKEVVRLAQGLPGIVEGTDTLNLILKMRSQPTGLKTSHMPVSHATTGQKRRI